MATYNIAPYQDGTSGSDANTYMAARNLYTPDPDVHDFMYMKFNTSSIGAGEVITAVRLWWHPYAYTAPKGTAKTWQWQHYNVNTTVATVIASGTYSAGAAWVTTSPVSCWTVHASENEMFGYCNQVIGKDISMEAYSTDYGTAGSRPYIEITTVVPSTGQTKTYIIMAG